eukprot:5504732-Prymnesium_polylepis.3
MKTKHRISPPDAPRTPDTLVLPPPDALPRAPSARPLPGHRQTGQTGIRARLRNAQPGAPSVMCPPRPTKELEHALLWVGGWVRAFVDGARGDAARLRGARARRRTAQSAWLGRLCEVRVWVRTLFDTPDTRVSPLPGRTPAQAFRPGRTKIYKGHDASCWPHTHHEID